MNKRWLSKEIPARDKIESLSAAINVNPYLSAVLVQRGIEDFECARRFFRPSLSDLHDPFLMKGMHTAVTRLKAALDANEKILIYGDYDVDGTTAVALVYCFLTRFHPHCEVYIPDRNDEGYGVSHTGIEWAAENDFTLIIALDCGIKSAELVEHANAKGIDFIICDHHLPDAFVPKAIAVLDPKQEDCS
jgi:single-stranded-DNA-specific exonuclease